MKRPATKWEKIFANLIIWETIFASHIISQRTESRIYEEFSKLNPEEKTENRQRI